MRRSLIVVMAVSISMGFEVAASSAETGAIIQVEGMKPVVNSTKNLDELSGGTAFTWIRVPKAVNIELGALVFTVEKSGFVYIKATWKYEGNADGGWTAERLSKKQLMEKGWEEVGTVEDDKDGFWFRRECVAGEKLRIRTNKYWPPSIYTPARSKEPIASIPSPMKPVLNPPEIPLQPPTASTAEKRQPPTDEDLKQAAVTVTDVFRVEIDKAKTREQRATLAKKLLQTGRETDNDLAGRFVLFRFARQAAVRAGDHQTALLAIDTTAKEFVVDALALKAEAIAEIVKVGRDGPESEQLAEHALALANVAVASDRFDIAVNLSKSATAAARNGRNPKQIAQLSTRERQIDESAKAFAALQESLFVLKRDPVDGAANLSIGRFRCFAVDQWDVGIPMLALGSDPELKRLATMEIAVPDAPADQLKIGDAWWSLAETGEAALGVGARRRATYWYKKVSPTLTGLSKAKVDQRLKEVESLAAPNR